MRGNSELSEQRGERRTRKTGGGGGGGGGGDTTINSSGSDVLSVPGGQHKATTQLSTPSSASVRVRSSRVSANERLFDAGWFDFCCSIASNRQTKLRVNIAMYVA